jgi:Single-strand binding protein family
MLSDAWPNLPLALNSSRMLPPLWKSRNIREIRLSPRRAPKRFSPSSLFQANPGSPVASVTIANNDFFNDGEGERQLVTTFVDVTAWGKSAENFVSLAKKGRRSLVRANCAVPNRASVGSQLLRRRCAKLPRNSANHRRGANTAASKLTA